MRCHPGLEHQQDLWYPGQTSTQELPLNLGTGSPPSSAQHVVNTHTGEGSVHMTTSALHATIMTMQHTCAGHPNKHLNIVLQFVYIVAAQSTAHHNATIGHGITENDHITLWKPLGTRNFNVPMAKFWETTIEMQASSQQTLKDGLVNHICRDHTEKFWETPVQIDQIVIQVHIFLGKTRTMMVTIEGTHQKVLVDIPLENSIINILTLLIQISGIMGTSREDEYSPMLGLMRDTISSTLHPYTHPHLH